MMKISAGCIIEVKGRMRETIIHGSLELTAPIEAPKQTVTDDFGLEEKEDMYSSETWLNQTSKHIARVHVVPEKPYGPKYPVRGDELEEYKDGTAVYADNDLFYYFEAALPMQMQVDDIIAFLPNVYQFPIPREKVQNSKPGHDYFYCQPTEVVCLVRDGEIYSYGYRVLGTVLSNRWADKIGLTVPERALTLIGDDEFQFGKFLPFLAWNDKKLKNKILLVRTGFAGYQVFDWETVGLTASSKLPRSLRWINLLSVEVTLPRPRGMEVKVGMNYNWLPVKANM
jgi:hypothetical protein